jgi:hypothetical protein
MEYTLIYETIHYLNPTINSDEESPDLGSKAQSFPSDLDREVFVWIFQS